MQAWSTFSERSEVRYMRASSAVLVAPTSVLTQSGVLAITVAPLAFLAALNPNFRVAPFSAVLVLLISGQLGEGPIESALTRLLDAVANRHYLVQRLSRPESMDINSLPSLEFGSTWSNPSINLEYSGPSLPSSASACLPSAWTVLLSFF